MKNLFDPETVNEIKSRLGNLTPESQRAWGKMTAAQCVAHCSAAMEWTVRDSFPPRMFLGRVIGGWIKPKVLRDDEPMRRNSPTVKSLVIVGDRNLTSEIERLSLLIDRFSAGGYAGCTTHPHPFFGPMTPEEWAILTYKHLDHHFRQFGV